MLGFILDFYTLQLSDKTWNTGSIEPRWSYQLSTSIPWWFTRT